MDTNRQLLFLGFSFGAIPFFGDSMSYQVSEERHEDTTDLYQPERPPRKSSPEPFYENTGPPALPVFGRRTRSDLNLAQTNSGTSDGYVEPETLKASSAAIVPLSSTKPTVRIRSIPSVLPPIPPRPPLDSDAHSDVTDRRAISETHPYDISKSIAESAMDISLLTANANQLRLLITYNQGSQTYLACITFIIMSLVLQMLVAVTMIIVSLTKKNLPEAKRQKLKIITSVGVAIITMINILVASLVVAEQNPAVMAGMIDAVTMASVSTTAAGTTTTTPMAVTSSEAAAVVE
ncbi:conserved hypothetical protein [Culex quinquefasciatus]|uniref:Ninjurin a n=1 Tax=Culex quinquefasciatus TaxID=7176 RepID=B0WC27_CULQU|nr:conserved hypothetical protein [Culex quinquefasciatus]|eukprot:XP_001846261.1 conserved hypothetical protein [Culex quinquefasciatus]